ncbi:MAG: sirohydrochlorin cobaltochelatase [Synergistaceae bacterium]|nr:sirohydrochlorin cobaltochelatase [Synergistaceae bacterium]
MHKFFTALVLVMLLMTPAMSSAHESHGKKSAMLVVSFGTSVPEARKAIGNIVDTVKKEFPSVDVRLAFTSNIIRRKIQREQGEFIPNPSQALAQLNDEGYSFVTVIPTHMIPGEEYDEVLGIVTAFAGIDGKFGFEGVRVCSPFLDGVGGCNVMADILMKRFAGQLEDKETGIILMGHGTPEHPANAQYLQLQLALNQRAYGRFFVGTVEAAPEIGDVVAELKRHPEIKKLTLSPLMIVAGDHAHNDLAGEDDPESWINVLKKEGYKDITTYLVGMGEDENLCRELIRKVYALYTDTADGEE